MTQEMTQQAPRWQRIVWFIMIWAISVVVVGVVAEALKRLILG